MKKILVVAVAAMVAFAADNANAQCIGCQQNAQPVFNSAPVQSYGAPVQNFAAPMQSYSAPVQNFAAPVQNFAAPVQSYAAPMQSYAAPMQSYAAPMQNYSAPMQNYAAPMQSYAAPMQSYTTAPSCCGCMGSQPIYGGTVTSGMVGTVIDGGTVIDSGTIMSGSVVEGTIISTEPVVAAPVEVTAEPMKEMKEDTSEPPVPAVSTPGPEADGT